MFSLDSLFNAPLFPAGYQHKNEIAEDVIASVGEQISLRCTVKGLARQDIVWRKDGFEIPRDGRFTVTSDGTLDINAVSQGDSGTYECRVRNGFGESAMKVRLNLVENEGMFHMQFALSLADIRYR